MTKFITGIQQAGIGVHDAEEAKHLYKNLFGMNVLVFDSKAEASLMKQYTGANVHSRRAILSLNMNGGGGFEIWQFTSRTPCTAATTPLLGDLGIYAIKIKSRNIRASHQLFLKMTEVTVSPLYNTPDNRLHFWLTDTYGHCFDMVEGDEWFKTGTDLCGGVVGAVIGVSDMQKAIGFYKEVLGIDEVIYSGTASLSDVPPGHMEGEVYERVLLKKGLGKNGAFSQLLGSVQIELVCAKQRTPQKIYAERYWGDCGFIHLCFDVLNMDGLKEHSGKAGFPFTVDSAHSFAMDDTAGRFCYVEDPDGTLIELVETHRVPILKKLGLYLNLQKRKHQKPLPEWMIGLMSLNKIR